LIATIDNPDVEKNLQLSIHTESLANAQLERLKPLFEKGFVSAKDLEEKKQALLIAQKEVSRANIERDNLRFYAPFDGIVGAYKKREGTQVNQGDAVVTLYDPALLIVDFDIPCTKLKRINVGQPLYVLKKRYTLSHVQKMLDSESHMCPADVAIICKNCVIGSTVHVDLVISEKKDAIVIPFQSLFLKSSKPYVYIVENGKVALVPVKTGLKQKDSIEIIEGLKVGQKLIIKGQERLYPELAVDIHTESANIARPSA
jgi:membrane fusion protein (multidrug efflux system)